MRSSEDYLAAPITRVTTLQNEEFPNLLWVEVEDEDGATGLGETFSLADAVAAYIHEGVVPYLLGQPASDIARHWTVLYRQRGRSGIGTEARGASALDIALWDLVARRADLPLWAMLGGRSRSRVRVYNTCGGPDYVRAPAVAARVYTGERLGDRFEDLWAFRHEPERLAEDLMASGIYAMKIWPFDEAAVATEGLVISASQLREGLEPLRRIREAFGTEMEVALELHANWQLPAATKIAKAAEEYQPMWLEDAMRLDSLDALDQLCHSTTIPILTGEKLGGRFSYKDLLDRTGVSIVMADPCWTGGVSEVRRIADLTAAYQRAFTLHDCTGPVSLAVGSHVALYAETAIYQEIVRAFLYGWYQEVAEGLPVVKYGYIEPTTRPGHGVTLRPGRSPSEGWHERTSRAEA